MDKKLTRDQWHELDDQFSRTPEHPEVEGLPGEHLALLNCFSFHPMSKQDAIKLAAELLAMDWREA